MKKAALETCLFVSKDGGSGYSVDRAAAPEDLPDTAGPA